MNRSGLFVLSAVLAVTVSTTAFAAAKDKDSHQESKPRHGGVVVEVNEIDYELVARDGTYFIHVSDHGKPISTKGWTGSIATIGGEKATGELVPSGENLLEVKGSLKAKPGARMLATIQAPGKKALQIRFTSK
jgi:hypothetical protein